MLCTNPREIRTTFHPLKKGLTTYMLVPCGICMACRINRATMWSDILLHELTQWQEACFITLTYNDKHLPITTNVIGKPEKYKHTLCKRDMTLFIKRLRRFLEPKKIKLLYAGEYGEESLRPHYHAIIFGLPPSSKTKLFIYKIWGKCEWQSLDVSVCIPQTISYVTGYVLKKVMGKCEKSEYGNAQPPFMHASQKLGEVWLEKNFERLEREGFIHIFNSKHPIPRKYRKKFDIKTPPKSTEEILKMNLKQKLKPSMQRKINVETKTAMKRQRNTI